MSNVVPFGKREGDIEGPYLEGPARCLTCAHDWHAVAPVGVVCMECPSCHLMRGAWFYAVHSVSAENDAWQCGCGCIVFAVDLRGILCMACGIRTSFVQLAEASP